MAKSNTRLELIWIGKETRPKRKPWILAETCGQCCVLGLASEVSR